MTHKLNMCFTMTSHTTIKNPTISYFGIFKVYLVVKQINYKFPLFQPDMCIQYLVRVEYSFRLFEQSNKNTSCVSNEYQKFQNYGMFFIFDSPHLNTGFQTIYMSHKIFSYHNWKIKIIDLKRASFKQSCFLCVTQHKN